MPLVVAVVQVGGGHAGDEMAEDGRSGGVA
jgi:hypothetical protein